MELRPDAEVPYGDALGAVRTVLQSYAARPDELPRSRELADAACAAARSARQHGVTLASLLADLGRITAETITGDANAAVKAARAIARWADREYSDLTGGGP